MRRWWIAGAMAVVIVGALALFRHRDPPLFDSARAFALLEAQCRLGPRVPGTDAHRAGRHWIEEHLQELSSRVEVHEVRGRSAWGDELAGWNLVAQFGHGGTPLLLGAHWDSRARADRDPDPARRGEPVLGANDGASGTALLLEMARLFSETAPPRRVIVAFFDLEDQGSSEDPDAFCLGSKALAGMLEVAPGSDAIIVDMVGGKGLELRPEGFSMDLAAPLVRELWTIAVSLGSTGFVADPGGYLTDDHVPFLRAGWRAVDLVDLRYPEWHTSGDHPEACDPASLARVGEVLRHYVYRLSS